MTRGGAILVGVVVLAVLTVAAAAQQVAQPPAEEAPLLNTDVVKLCKLDLGDDVVIAKINQAKAVEFKLDTDSLVALKQEGVSKGVIAAMLKRTTAASSGQPAGTQSISQGQGSAAGRAAGGAGEGVWLRMQGAEAPLRSVQGDFSTTYAFVTVLFFLDFPGLHADLRIADTQPTVVVRVAKDPRGRVFFVQAESNKKDKTRSVKVGRGSPFGMKSWSTPDSDWTVECDAKELQPGLWEMTPKKPLKKGEYGVLFRGGFLGNLSSEQGELFDFGVD